MEKLFKNIDSLTNARNQSRPSARSRSASTRSRSDSEGSRVGSSRSRADSALKARDNIEGSRVGSSRLQMEDYSVCSRVGSVLEGHHRSKTGLPVRYRIQKSKDKECHYRRAKLYPVEVWSSKD